jgi:hypothetical protein
MADVQMLECHIDLTGVRACVDV